LSRPPKFSQNRERVSRSTNMRWPRDPSRRTTSRSSRGTAARNATNRRNQSGAQYSNLSQSLRHHEAHLLTENLPWSVPSTTSSIGLKIGCGGSPLFTETCSHYVDGRQPEGQIFLRWMRVAAPAGSSLGSLKRIPRESYSASMSTQPLAFAQPPKALARSVPDRSTGCRSQMVLFRRLSALTSCATVA
jgi:hypothetical protein